MGKASAPQHIDRMANIALQIEICEGKRSYPTRGRAIIAAGVRRLRLNPYRCPICDRWHLTKQQGDKRNG